MRTLSKVVYIFDRHDIKEWKLSPLRDLSESSQNKPTGLTPGAEVVDAAAVGLEGIEGESISSKESTAHCGPEIPLSALASKFPHPTQPPTVEDDSSLILKHPRPLNTAMAFFGLRKWPTPVSARLL
jgi:hypothetical protein